MRIVTIIAVSGASFAVDLDAMANRGYLPGLGDEQDRGVLLGKVSKLACEGVPLLGGWMLDSGTPAAARWERFQSHGIVSFGIDLAQED